MQTGLNAIIQTTPKSSELLTSRLFFLSDLVFTFTPSYKARYLPEAQISLQTNIIMYFSSEKHITVFLSVGKWNLSVSAGDITKTFQENKRVRVEQRVFFKNLPLFFVMLQEFYSNINQYKFLNLPAENSPVIVISSNKTIMDQSVSQWVTHNLIVCEQSRAFNATALNKQEVNRSQEGGVNHLRITITVSMLVSKQSRSACRAL